MLCVVTAVFEAGTEDKADRRSKIETRPFWPYSYILWKVVYRNTHCMCIVLVANIIWRSGRAVRSPFLLDFSFLHHSCRRVFTVFYVTALICNINVLAARLMETLFGCQMVPPIRKKMFKENSLGANYFKQLSTRKYRKMKKLCHRHSKVNLVKMICLVESFT